MAMLWISPHPSKFSMAVHGKIRPIQDTVVQTEGSQARSLSSTRVFSIRIAMRQYYMMFQRHEAGNPKTKERLGLTQKKM
jgi:hypothetical protein